MRSRARRRRGPVRDADSHLVPQGLRPHGPGRPWGQARPRPAGHQVLPGGRGLRGRRRGKPRVRHRLVRQRLQPAHAPHLGGKGKRGAHEGVRQPRGDRRQRQLLARERHLHRLLRRGLHQGRDHHHHRRRGTRDGRRALPGRLLGPRDHAREQLRPLGRRRRLPGDGRQDGPGRRRGRTTGV